MLDKILSALSATVRDILLAGVAAASGYLLSQELPKNWDEAKALIVAALYMGLRTAVAFAVTLLK
jgi:predicted regulator of Ras-like GTPase activity (Roadblock/LC7/MglB family)